MEETRNEYRSTPWYKNGVSLPNDTRLRMVDGLKVYDAVIRGGAIEVGGSSFENPSAAAIHCTGKSLNGWIYWLAKRPGDIVWTLLSWFRAGRTADEE